MEYFNGLSFTASLWSQNTEFSNQQNMKIGLMSAVLIFFQLSSKKPSVGPTFILGAKKRLLKFVI